MKRQFVRQEKVCDDGSAPDVGLEPIMFIVDYFRGHVVDGAHGTFKRFLAATMRSMFKVSQFNLFNLPFVAHFGYKYIF